MIITKDSHLDHGLNGAHVAFLMKEFAHIDGFSIQSVEVPPELPPLTCALWGPLMGDPRIVEDSVRYQIRGDRPGASRMMRCNDKCCRARPTRTLTIIAGPHDGQVILYTAFGGPNAPREPFDPSLDDAGRAESKAFWAQHALASETSKTEAEELRAGLASIRDRLDHADVIAHRDLDVPVSAMADGVHFARGVALRLVGVR